MKIWHKKATESLFFLKSLLPFFFSSFLWTRAAWTKQVFLISQQHRPAPHAISNAYNSYVTFLINVYLVQYTWYGFLCFLFLQFWRWILLLNKTIGNFNSKNVFAHLIFTVLWKLQPYWQDFNVFTVVFSNMDPLGIQLRSPEMSSNCLKQLKIKILFQLITFMFQNYDLKAPLIILNN